jgi:CheY-like chemotaxis protein
MMAIMEKRIKVLTVDDSHLDRKLINGFLSSMHIDFETAANGREAYRLVKENIHMPYMDGYECSKLIRNEFNNLGVEIIAVSGLSYDEVKSECLEVGITKILTKPINQDELKKLFS